MVNKVIHDIVEQNAVYDGKPEFPPCTMLMSILNHYCIGGTASEAALLRDSGEAENAKLYKVRIIIETEELS